MRTPDWKVSSGRRWIWRQTVERSRFRCERSEPDIGSKQALAHESETGSTYQPLLAAHHQPGPGLVYHFTADGACIYEDGMGISGKVDLPDLFLLLPPASTAILFFVWGKIHILHT